jgi:cell fate regulator YaaT (PSP1 superfamily)
VNATPNRTPDLVSKLVIVFTAATTFLTGLQLFSDKDRRQDELLREQSERLGRIERLLCLNQIEERMNDCALVGVKPGQ